MDDYSQIILLVVSIIIFAVSSLRKKNKKAQGQPAEPGFGLEELFGIPSVEMEEYVPQPIEPQPIQTIKPTNNPVTKPQTNYIEGQKGIVTPPKSTPVKKEQTPVNKGFNNINWPQAIIYSEILKRPHY